MRKTGLKDGQAIERNIFARVATDGRVTAFQVKIRIRGTDSTINERFESLDEARSYRDSLRADLALEPYKERVLRAREEVRRRERISAILLDDALTLYLERVVPTKKSAYTQRYMIGRLRQHSIKKLPLVSVTDRALQDLANWLSDGVERSTVAKYLALLSAVFKWAKDAYQEPRLSNPVADLPAAMRCTASAERDRRLFPGEEAYLREALSQSSNSELVPAFDLALETGARLSELLNMKRQDVDLANRVATVRETKNGDDRQLLLSPAAIRVLQDLLARPVQQIDGGVFRLRRVNLSQRWTEAKKRARLAYEHDCEAAGREADPHFFADLRWHDLRHDAISRAAELGWSEVQLMLFSGHREPRMVLRYVQYRQRTALALQFPDRARTA